METYSIICKTDLYHARRYAGFGRLNGTKVLDTHLTLKDAQNRLLGYFNRETGLYHKTWSQAVLVSRAHNEEPYNSIEANKTHRDGTRSFCSDIFTYSIEMEEDEE